MFFNNNRIFMGKDLASKTKVVEATVCFKVMLLLSLHHFCVGVSCLVLDCDPVWYVLSSG